MSSTRSPIGSLKDSSGRERLSNSLNRPKSAGGSNNAGSATNLSPATKTRRKGSPIMHKIAALFRRNPDHEEGVVSVRPSCFDDDRYQRRSESPEAVDGGKRRNSNSSNKQFKIRKSGGGKEKQATRMWRPKGRLEWESDSGRQLTLTDVSVNDLSKVEIQTLQRQSIPKLQAMEIPASHGLLKTGSRNMLARLSFNTLKQRKVNVPDKSDLEPPNVIFGQPLSKLLPQDQLKSHSGCSTPVPSVPSPQPRTFSSVNGAASVSPTSTSSDASYHLDSEPNPTTLLLEALDAMPPSPKAQRRMSLCPAEPQVPDIVKKAIHYLDTKGVKTEGIFRIPGAKTRIDEIREKFDSGEDVELTDDMNPHDVACLLKEFFRSLPEPLLTRDLYQPFLTTQKLPTPAARRDALRLLCLLLPHANRDTLQELLRFLTRVALRSNGIILIDGTEESGNLMTERNLAMIIGPNILHRELKRKNQEGKYQVQKQDAEELSSVCKVVEDLIQMQTSIFTVPAKLYDECLKEIMTSDPEALNQLLKRKCYEQGLFLESPDFGLGARSRSSEALRKVSLSSNNADSSSLATDHDTPVWENRRRSLSDTQKKLDEIINNLVETLDQEINIAKERHRHFSSTDSAMGETESIVSPIQSEYASSEPSTLVRKRQVYHSMDSAFSNNSSPTNSSEGVNNSDLLSMESDSAFNLYGHSHTRMSSGISGISGVSSVSPVPIPCSPEPSASPQLRKKDSSLCSTDTSSLPALYSSPERTAHSSGRKDHPYSAHMLSRGSHTLPHTSSTPSRSVVDSRSRQPNAKLKHKTLPPSGNAGTYCYSRSPILNSREVKCNSESQLDALSSDHTPTESTSNITSSPSGFSLDSSQHGHQYVDDGTVI